MLQTAQEPDSTQLSPRKVRAQQANTPWGRALRYVGLILGIYVGWNLGVSIGPDEQGPDAYGFPIIIAASLGALLFMLTPYLTIGIFSRLRQELRRIEASDLVAAAAGLLIGGLVSALLAFPLSTLPDPFGQYIPVVVLVAICSVAVLATITKKRELMGLIGLRRPEVIAPTEDADETEAARTIIREREALLDTSAIIDGRVQGLSAEGFLPFRLVVPQFVLRELQLVADSDDYSRRVRGSRGLQTLEAMREHADIDIEIRQLDAEGPDVDSQLVNVARSLDIPILSGDTNMERVASLQDVQFLNLHNLSELMRPALNVGDAIELKIVQKGREYQQGVGFLNDGTMLVVDDGERYIGDSVGVVITRILQTSSGRMMFARLDVQEAPAE